MRKIICLFFAVGFLTSCLTTTSDDFTTDGLKPIYFSGADWKDVKTSEARSLQNLGKIYYKDQIIYVSEVGKGIHVIDNSDSRNPQPIKFIEVPGAKDIAIKGNILYADNYLDLVALDISDFANIQLVKRVENLYPENQTYYPSDYSGYFECADPDKGLVIGWEEAELKNPGCQR